MDKGKTLSAERRRKTIMSVVLAVICIIYVLPVLTVVINSFKYNTYVKTDTFALPLGEMWAGFKNFIKGMTFGNYPFWKSAAYSLSITVISTALILLFTSMAAWYIARVDSLVCKAIYYLCVFSMVVPFQMVMFTLSKTADKLHLNTPWTIPIVYLGFGAGLAIFMFVGFVKSIPIEIEEAAAIDGCPADAQAHHDLRRHPRDHVGLERLSAPRARAGHQRVPHDPDPHPVPQGQLRHRRPRRHDGAHPHEHHPGDRVLSALPEAHH